MNARLLLSVFAALSLASLSACHARSNVRLSRISTDDGQRTEITYDADGYLTQTNRFDNDNFLQRVDVTWTDGVLTEYTVTNDGSAPYTANVGYDDKGRLRSVEGSNADLSISTTLTYNEQGKVDRVQRSIANLVTTDFDFRFDYDDKGRTTKVSTTSQVTIEVFGVSNTTTTLVDDVVNYDDQNRVNQVVSTTSGSGNGTDTVAFTYDADNGGRLSRVGDGGKDYRIDYDVDGRMNEVLQNDSDNVQITTLEYDEGKSQGFTWTPSIPQQSWFDLEGQSFSTLDPMTPPFFFAQ